MKNFGASTIFVAGGTGFIGSHFIRRILTRHPRARVVNFDKLTYCGNPENLHDIADNPRYLFIKGDIADRAALERALQKYRPRFVINFAAATHVDRSIHEGAADFIRTNVVGVRMLLDAIRAHGGVEKFVQVSSDEVYGDLPLRSAARFDEDSALRPNSPYAASKAAGDLLCRAHFRTHATPVVVTRSSNNYGSHQYPEKLIPFFVLRMLEGKTLPLYGDGRHVRDWLYVGDHGAALEAALLSGKSGAVYNVGAENERSNREIALRILKHFGASQSRIEYIADRPGHDRRYALNASKIRKELGWRPSALFEDEFAHTIEWYRNNKAWIAGIKKRIKKINPHITS